MYHTHCGISSCQCIIQDMTSRLQLIPIANINFKNNLNLKQKKLCCNNLNKTFPYQYSLKLLAGSKILLKYLILLEIINIYSIKWFEFILSYYMIHLMNWNQSTLSSSEDQNYYPLNLVKPQLNLTDWKLLQFPFMIATFFMILSL